MNLQRLVKIKVVGNNVDNYLKRMIKRKINFVKVINVSKGEVYIVLKYCDYLELMKYKTIYEIEIVGKYGILGIVERLKENRILIIFIILGLMLLYGLSNLIFRVDVIHHDKYIRELVEEELKSYGIKKYAFRKNYLELESIEDKILKNNKDELEWLEISVDGTFVSVRVEERVINEEEETYKYQSIVSKKNAVIKRIDAVRGEVVREKDTYVKKGDVIISGYITLPDNSSSLTMAEGEVYGEVWYEVDIDYPFLYQESNLTGRSSKGVTIDFFGKKISLFNRGKYKSFSVKNDVLFEDNFLNLRVIWEKRYELEIKDEVYTEELVESKAISYIKEKLMKDNSDISEVSDVKVMDREVDYDGVRFKLFVTTIESIGEVLEIEDDIEGEIE